MPVTPEKDLICVPHKTWGMAPSLFIFDLDGTLALVDHRRPILDSEDPDRWRRFFEACVDDEPNWPVIWTLWALRKSGAEIWIFSGRGAAVMDQTRAWLAEVGIGDEVQLTMRPEGDYTPDEELKRRWLEEMSDEDRRRLVGVFDDRDKVVAMWRSEGEVCFQVAPGAF